MTTLIRSAVGSAVSLGLISFLQEHGFNVVGTDIVENTYVTPLVDRYYQVAKADQAQRAIQHYVDIIAETSASWLLSGPEHEIELLATHRDQLAPCQLFHPDTDTLATITHKWTCYTALSDRFTMPASALLSDWQQWPSDKTAIVLKPVKGRGSAGVHVTEARYLEHWAAMLPTDTYMIQAYIEGVEYSVDTLHDLSSHLLSAVSRERVSVDSGLSVIGKTVKHEPIYEQVVALSQALHLKGASCIQFIQANDGALYLTDINPRFGGGAILSLHASASFRHRVVELLKGTLSEGVHPSFDVEEGLMLRSYVERYEF